MRALFGALLLLAIAGQAVAQDPAPRGMRELAEQIGPSVMVFDTTITTGAASNDTLYFGFYCDWYTIEVYDAACSLATAYDEDFIPKIPGVVVVSAGADSARWLNSTSGRAARGAVYLMSANLFYVPAGASAYYPERVAALRVKGTGTGTAHIRAGGSLPSFTRY